MQRRAREELQMFARGKDANNSPMYVKILDAFEDLKKQQDALRASVDALKIMIRDLEDKPKDSSYDEEIKELKREEAALLTVLQEIGKKNIFNFLSDEGLLPNYAFPEAGIIHRSDTKKVVCIHYDSILCNTFPYRDVASLFPIHICKT